MDRRDKKMDRYVIIFLKHTLFFVGDFLFEVYGTDQAIANYIERVEYAYTQADCCAKCTLDPRCLPVNYQRSTNDDGTHTCDSDDT